MQQTSLMSFVEIQHSLGERQKLVFGAIMVLKEATNLELSNFLKLPINSVTPRVFELRKKGIVVESSRRTCTVSGRMAICWKVI